MSRRGGLAVVCALLLALLQAPAAWAHATLLAAEPADGVVLGEAPRILTLTFNEPVSPLVIRLIRPDGSAATPKVTSDNATISVLPPPLTTGTHILSWRVVSADGHPVGGSVAFSIGQATSPPSAQTVSEPAVAAAIWLVRVALYVALIVGGGGAVFRIWWTSPASGGSPQHWADRSLVWILAAGLALVPLSVGLQGLDALALPLSALADAQVWRAVAATAYAWTAAAAVVALAASLAALTVSRRLARPLAALSLIAVGTAFALSGHASSASPQLLARPSVFLHVVCVALWIGAFLPLLAAVSAGRRATALRFSRAIPVVLLAMAASGVVLIVLQFDRPDALWTTEYGLVLMRKLVVIGLLLMLGALNRYWLVPSFLAGVGRRAFAVSLVVELCLALTVLGLVGGWRFTPPPRALAATGSIFLHLHGDRAMAHVEIVPVRARGAVATIQLLNHELGPYPAKDVTFILANAGDGIEPIRRAATTQDGVTWRISELRLPVAGRWSLELEILISDFERIRLRDDVELPRLP